MKRELINKTISNIIETIKFLNWKLTQIWVENNCIYGERIRVNGEKITEGIYAGSDFDYNDVYKVYNELKKVLDFQGLLIDNNII